MLVRCDLVKLQRLLTTEQHQTFTVVHTHDLIGKHEGPLCIAFGLAVWPGGIINWRKERQKRHLVVLHLDGDHAALFRDVGRCIHIVASKADLDVRTADELLPLCFGYRS